MKAKRIRFPILVKRGSSVVKIYRDRKPTGTYYRVVYHIGGKRHRLHFNDLEKATSEAEAKAAQLSRGDIDAMQLNGEDRLVYGRALEAIRGHAMPLDAVALQFADACKLLDGATLLDAAKFYARHHRQAVQRKSVADAVSAMIDAKRLSGVSKVYLAYLRYHLHRFAEFFRCDLCSIASDDVRSFLESLSLSPRSYNNALGALRTFFGFAVNRAWISKEIDLLQSVERRKEHSAPVEILTPTEMASLMQHADPSIVPCLALGAFAGLRSEEIIRLEWADLTRRPGFIEVAAHKAKTASRRLVPITDNLAKWLAHSGTVPVPNSLVWPGRKAEYFAKRLRTAACAGLDWKPNVLRHSFISYRLADTQDINRVALEAGNSPQMIFRHYRELATPDQARTWFSIAPAEAQNVVAMTAKRSVA